MSAGQVVVCSDKGCGKSLPIISPDKLDDGRNHHGLALDVTGQSRRFAIGLGQSTLSYLALTSRAMV